MCTAIRRQGNQVTAVIVQHGQRSNRLRPSLGTFEVHLPKFVGLPALKALPGPISPVLVAH